MIYTCTLNPSLDYFINLDGVEVGELNRSKGCSFKAGGKGINVSSVLSNLDISSKALGFVGGFTKDYFIEKLGAYKNVQPNFIYIEGNTRINVKMLSGQETDINAIGPIISEKEKEMMLKRIEKMTSFDTFILSGSIPVNCDDLVFDILKVCERNQVQVVLDTSPYMMVKLLKYKPMLVKPNLEELEQMFDKNICTYEEIIECATQIVSQGAKNCIVSLGSDGAILVNDTGVYKSSAINDEIIKTTGAGDSLVAGFVMNYLRSKDFILVFKYACACASATITSKDFATAQKVEYYADKITIDKLK